MVIIALFLVGLCFGSFINALVWRVHQQSKAQSPKHKARYSISRGRSVCVHCEHQLAATDLIPVLSWVLLRGRCRYCKKPISAQYPLVELITAGLFILSYVLWPEIQNGWEWAQFGAWLALLVGLIALAVYDLKWMLLPNRILYPLYVVGGIFVLTGLPLTDDALSYLANVVLSVAIGGGIFYLLFQLSKGKWIGGGDVKLGFLLGAVALKPLQTMLLLFLASIFGLIFSLPLLTKNKKLKSVRIPFGPFLILGAVVTVLFGQQIIDWYIDLISI